MESSSPFEFQGEFKVNLEFTETLSQNKRFLKRGLELREIVTVCRRLIRSNQTKSQPGDGEVDSGQ